MSGEYLGTPEEQAIIRLEAEVKVLRDGLNFFLGAQTPAYFSDDQRALIGQVQENVKAILHAADLTREEEK